MRKYFLSHTLSIVHKPFLISIFFILCNLLSSESIKAQTRVYGDSIYIGSGIAKCWVDIDAQNIPLQIGLTLRDVALSTLPNSDLSRSINLPLITVDSLFHHVYFNWNPHGHPPNNIYTVPHLDFHFYIIPRIERVQIPGGFHNVPVDHEFMPDRFIFIPEEEFFSVPQMGVHYVDSLAPELNGSPFDNTLIYGFYNGKMIFVEPMITREYLQGFRNSFSPIPHPISFQKTGYYPTTYQVYSDSTADFIEIILRDFVFRAGVSSAENLPQDNPDNFFLAQNYPNPFNPKTTIRWQIPISGWQTLKVFDILGNEVATLVDEFKAAGQYEIIFDASNLASGIYLYKLSVGSNTLSKKIVLLK